MAKTPKKAAASPPEPPSTKVKDFAGSAADLAEWCDISVKTVEHLVQNGVFTRVGPNLFALKANNRAYIAKLRTAASGRNSVNEAARGRLLDWKAKQIELKVGELDGKLVYVTEVEAHWANALRTFRASALAIPTRVAARVPGLNREVVYEMNQEIREALTEMARNGYPEPSAASVGPAISAPAAEPETE